MNRTLDGTTLSAFGYKALMTSARLFLSYLSFTFAIPTHPPTCLQGCAAEAGFVPIFDGKTLNGWHASAKTGHSRASKNTTGGKWVVENGVMVGSQDIPGNGGIIIT